MSTTKQLVWMVVVVFALVGWNQLGADYRETKRKIENAMTEKQVLAVVDPHDMSQDVDLRQLANKRIAEIHHEKAVVLAETAKTSEDWSQVFELAAAGSELQTKAVQAKDEAAHLEAVALMVIASTPKEWDEVYKKARTPKLRKIALRAIETYSHAKAVEQAKTAKTASDWLTVHDNATADSDLKKQAELNFFRLQALKFSEIKTLADLTHEAIVNLNGFTEREESRRRFYEILKANFGHHYE